MSRHKAWRSSSPAATHTPVASGEVGGQLQQALGSAAAAQQQHICYIIGAQAGNTRHQIRLGSLGQLGQARQIHETKCVLEWRSLTL